MDLDAIKNHRPQFARDRFELIPCANTTDLLYFSSLFQVRLHGGSFTVWDVGGQDKLRPLWRSYTRATDGIIFVVDSCKEDRLEEAKLELQRFCKSPGGVPVLVLANKQDLPAALEAAKLEQRLGLRETLGSPSSWHLQPTCAVTGDGLEEGMKVLHEMILRKRKARGSSNGKLSAAAAAASAKGRKLQRSHSHVY